MATPQLECNKTDVLTFSAPTSEGGPVESITLKNPYDLSVAFKVKTTAPKAYLVRPSTGIILPNESCTIDILLVCDEKSNAKIAMDRFQIITVFRPDNTKVDKAQWSQIPKSEINEIKFRASMSPDATTNNISDRLVALTSQTLPDDYHQLKKSFGELVVVATSLEATNNELRTKLNLRESPTRVARVSLNQMNVWKVAFLILLIANLCFWFGFGQ